MDLLKDFKYVTEHSFKKTIESLKKNYLIIFTVLVYWIITLTVGSIVSFIFRGPLWIISGFITYFIQSAIISNYLYLLFNIINYNRFNLNDFKQGFTAFLWKIYGVFFILYIGELLLSALGNILGTAAVFLNLIIMIAALVLLNALPESIYLRSNSPVDTLMYALGFMKENWLNWGIPNIILMGLIYLTTGNILTSFVNTSIGFVLGSGLKDIALYFIGQIIFSFMMIYRGHLFKILSTSTRRKRMFINKF
ncbi:hypothetical protein E9840_11165 [Tissierella creatinini]|nr:hypothetical protein E9840_11165 [Tissierella creatinini]TJX63210.1 hypothetical protein E8P77_15500 [Soehngenia saccharolytica]